MVEAVVIWGKKGARRELGKQSNDGKRDSGRSRDGSREGGV